MKNITIVDYGSGNVLSAQKSFIKISKDNNIQANVIISKNVNDINLSFLQWLSKTKDTETLQLSKSFKTDFGIIDKLNYKRKNINLNISKEDYMTETLAKMYIKQNKLKEALKAYKILSLKYPEKISLFANQIDFIKNKLKNE